jgi:predicted transglutaminase-like cysteine proteinase
LLFRVKIFFTLLLALSFSSISPALAIFPNIFGFVAHYRGPVDLLEQWEGVVASVERSTPSYQACQTDPNVCPSKAVMRWQKLLKNLEGQPLLTQAVGVNSFVNRKVWRSDKLNYGRSDYWASPDEFLTKSGDCEDYAITKYFSLRQLGVDIDKLRLVVSKRSNGQVHAFLSVNIDDELFILDNLSREVMWQIEAEQQTPIYSFNETSVWIHAAPEPMLLSSMARVIEPAVGPCAVQGR